MQFHLPYPNDIAIKLRILQSLRLWGIILCQQPIVKAYYKAFLLASGSIKNVRPRHFTKKLSVFVYFIATDDLRKHQRYGLIYVQAMWTN